MDRLRDWLHALQIAAQLVCGARLVATRPKELLEVQRAHGDLPFVSNRQRRRVVKLPEAHAQQRTRADYVKAAILREVLESGPGGGTLLELVEKNERLARHEPHTGDEQRHARVDVFRRERTIEDAFQLRVLDKVDIDEAFVLAAPKLSHDERLAHLARAVDEKTLCAMGALPLPEGVEHLALEHRVLPTTECMFFRAKPAFACMVFRSIMA